jgi:protein ImuA
MPHDNKPALEDLHPALWRASQLARSGTRVIDTGHPILSAQLPGGGWPVSTLVECLVEKPGSGEIRLLKPVLAKVGKRRVMLIQPPHVPNALALASMGLNPSQVLWVQPSKNADALWAAEQALKAGGFHTVLMWVQHARNENWRRLNLAAQAGDSLFIAFRPISAAQDASPAPLRLALRAEHNGVRVDLIKRRGPNKETSLFIPLSPSYIQSHAPVDRPTPIEIAARGLRPQLVVE